MSPPYRLARTVTSAVAATLAAALCASSPSHCATFTVNSAADADDASKGNGTCATSTGVCTLRAAVSEANKLSGGPHSIVVPAGTFAVTAGEIDVSVGMTISGAGAATTTVSGNASSRIFRIQAGSDVYVSDMTVTNGSAASGGCMYNSSNPVHLARMKLTGCSGQEGGAFYTNSGQLWFTDVTVSNCSATGKGGGIYTQSGDLYLDKVTISNNTAPTGGGIANQSSNLTTLTNVTISGNTASSQGGAIYSMSGNAPALTNVTLAYNQAPAGAALSTSSGAFRLKNTIVAGSGPGTNCVGSVISGGSNIDSGNSCGLNMAGDLVNTDPRLGVLQDNGGPTLTHALIIGSPAIDAGTSNGAPATDQRGLPRPAGIAWDIGAYEGTFIPSFQPDAAVKLATEGAEGYLTGNLYEANAAVQVKNGTALSGGATSYRLRIQNDGNVGDLLKIAGTGSGAGFTVQYLDDTGADRTAAVTGAGFTTGVFPPGMSKEWSVNVAVAGAPSPVPGGTAYHVFITASSGTDSAKTDQVVAVTTSTSANITLTKSSDRPAPRPGDDITFSTNATNGSALTTASNLTLMDSIPASTAFKVVAGNASFAAGTTSLGCTIAYSRNNRSTWDYTPTPGGCSAPLPYDYCVTDIRWSTSGSMPANTSFAVGFVVGVK